MNRIIIILFVGLVFWILKLLLINRVLQKNHHNKMYELKKIMLILRKKQEVLLQKTTIVNQFKQQQKVGLQKINEEIFFLQKTIFELLSKK